MNHLVLCPSDVSQESNYGFTAGLEAAGQLGFLLLLSAYITFYIIYYSVLRLIGKSHGQRSLAGCSPWGLKELDMTE